MRNVAFHSQSIFDAKYVSTVLLFYVTSPGLRAKGGRPSGAVAFSMAAQLLRDYAGGFACQRLHQHRLKNGRVKSVVHIIAVELMNTHTPYPPQNFRQLIPCPLSRFFYKAHAILLFLRLTLKFTTHIVLEVAQIITTSQRQHRPKYDDND